jgi:amino acid transporter
VRHLVAGYLLVYLTPLISILLLLASSRWIREVKDYVVPIMVHTGISMVVIAAIIIGVGLYVFGYKKQEMKMEEPVIILILSVPLILLGVFVTLVTVGFYRDLIEWSEMPETRGLTIWITRNMRSGHLRESYGCSRVSF